MLSAMTANSVAADSIAAADGCVPEDPTGARYPQPRSGDRWLASHQVISVRDDLRALEGYHSAQVDVAVRLNTNESPEPPPVAFRDAFAAELSRVEWHRYPDRSALALRTAIADFHDVSPEQVFAANGSNEVLQTVLLAYAGPGRTVATFEPTYQMHAQIARVTGATVVEGQRGEDFTLDPREVERVIATYAPDVVFLTSPNNPTGLVEPAERVVQLLELSDGLVVVDEAYAQFADWSALDLARRRPAPRGHADVLQDLVDGRCPSRLPDRPTVARRRTRQGRAAVPPRHGEADRRSRSRCGSSTTWTPGSARSSASANACRRPCAACRATWCRAAPTSCCSARRSANGRAVWQGLVDRDVLVRDCSSWPHLDNCLRVTIGTPQENTTFIDALAAVLGDPSIRQEAS